MDLLVWLANHWGDILTTVTTVIAAASVVVKLTPTQTDDRALGKVVRVLEALALNRRDPPVRASTASDRDLDRVVDELLEGDQAADVLAEGDDAIERVLDARR